MSLAIIILIDEQSPEIVVVRAIDGKHLGSSSTTQKELNLSKHILEHCDKIFSEAARSMGATYVLTRENWKTNGSDLK